MCAPALGAVVGILSSVVQFGAAQAEYEAKAEAWRQNYVNALAAGRDEHTQIQLRQLQENKKFAQAQHMTMVEEAQKKAEVVVAAAGQGVSGNSVDNLVSDVIRQGAYTRQVNEENYKMTAQQLEEQNKGVVSTEQNRINSMERPVAPNPLTLVVGILGAGVKAFSSMDTSSTSYAAA